MTHLAGRAITANILALWHLDKTIISKFEVHSWTTTMGHQAITHGEELPYSCDSTVSQIVHLKGSPSTLQFNQVGK